MANQLNSSSNYGLLRRSMNFNRGHFANPRKRSEKNFNTMEDLPKIMSSQGKPLMGTEYTLGTHVNHFKCVLCNKSFHMNLVVGHLSGNSHRLKYCEEHFLTLSTYLESAKDTNGDAFVSDLLDIVAFIIDQQSSCKEPYKYSHTYYENNQQLVYDQIKNAPHVNSATKIGLENILLDAVTQKCREMKNSLEIFGVPSKKSEPKLKFKVETQSEQISLVTADRAGSIIENTPLVHQHERDIQQMSTIYQTKLKKNEWKKRIESFKPGKSMPSDETCSSEVPQALYQIHHEAPPQYVPLPNTIIGTFPLIPYVNFQQVNHGLPPCFLTYVFDTVKNSNVLYGFVFNTSNNCFMPYEVIGFPAFHQ